MAYKLPKTTHGHRFWDQLAAIYQELGSEAFEAWAMEKVRPREGWSHMVMMMAWNDHNSEYNLDRSIAEFRETREGDKVTEKDLIRDLESMLEGMI